MSTEDMSTQATGDHTIPGDTAGTGDPPTTTTAWADAGTVERCGQCGAPAAHDQRYCLNCGFHRRNAPDPVSRYLSEASVARARVAEATALAAQRRRSPKIGLRLTATFVAFALLIGIVIGNATGGHSAAPPAAKKHPVAQKHSSQVKNATGSSYLQQEQNLPNSVTP